MFDPGGRSHYYILKHRKALPVRDMMTWARWRQAEGYEARKVAETLFRNQQPWIAQQIAEHEKMEEWRAANGYGRRAETNVVDLRMHYETILISTVFLGLDHNHFGFGPPILFETMVFKGPLDQMQQRYADWDSAEQGHKAVCELVRLALAAPVETAEGGGK